MSNAFAMPDLDLHDVAVGRGAGARARMAWSIQWDVHCGRKTDRCWTRSLAAARRLTVAGIKPEHADAIVDGVRQAADAPADMATKADLAALEARLTWRFAGAMLAQTGVILTAVIGAAVAILRMFGS